MTSVQKLNAVLHWLAVNPFAKPFVTDGYIKAKLEKLFEELAEQSDWGLELHRILDKLEKDGYVRTELRDVLDEAGNYRTSIQKHYSITFEGEQFEKFGGYMEPFNSGDGDFKLSEREIIILNETLPFIPGYTGYVFFFVMQENTSWKETNPAFSDRDHASKIATRIYRFLINNGFAADIEGSRRETILMTEKGRSLTRLGSLQGYTKEISELEMRKSKREKWGHRKAWWDAHGGILITIISVLIALSSLLGVKSCNDHVQSAAQKTAK